jgi:hypothetical protein
MMGILRNIEQGEVDAYEFAQLWNFVATMLTLLSKVEPNTLSTAKKETEIAAILKNEIEDFEVFANYENNP